MGGGEQGENTLVEIHDKLLREKYVQEEHKRKYDYFIYAERKPGEIQNVKRLSALEFLEFLEQLNRYSKQQEHGNQHNFNSS